MEDSYTPIHNDVLEALAQINLSPYETRVLLAIWRKTYGFKDPKTGNRKKKDKISGSQLTKITHLDRRLVSRALKGLENKFVISRDDKGIGFSKKFMKNLSSVEMTPVISRDDNLSSVEMHTKENKRKLKNNVSKNSEKIKYYAELLAKELNDDKSIAFYKQAVAQFDPHQLLQKAKEIVKDGGAKNPGAVFTAWYLEEAKKLLVKSM